MSKSTKAAKAADDSTKPPVVDTKTGASTPMPSDRSGTADAGAASGAAPAEAAEAVDAASTAAVDNVSQEVSDTPNGGALSDLSPDMLIGSNAYPALIAIHDQQVQLGTVVHRAHQHSGLSVADWNALDDGTRDRFIDDAIARLRDRYVACWPLRLNGRRFAARQPLPPDALSAAEAESLMRTGAIERAR